MPPALTRRSLSRACSENARRTRHRGRNSAGVSGRNRPNIKRGRWTVNDSEGIPTGLVVVERLLCFFVVLSLLVKIDSSLFLVRTLPVRIQ